MLLETKSFPLTYDDIYEQSKKLNFGEYTDVVDHAFAVRKGEKTDEIFLYRNVSLLNKIIKNRILESFREEGDKELI